MYLIISEQFAKNKFIYFQCRETGYMCHEELVKVLHELQNVRRLFSI